MGFEIGGGVVRRRFRLGERDLAQGASLNADEIARIPPKNRRALIANRFLAVWPKLNRSAKP